MGRLRNCIPAVVFALLAAAPVCAKVADKYDIVRVAPEGFRISSMSGISNSGIVFGRGYNATNTWGIYRYNLNTGASEFTDQMYLPGDINSSGSVAGLYSMRNGSDQYCVWNSDGSITDLPKTDSSFLPNMRINDSGTVLGNLSGILPSGRVFLWNLDSGISRPPLPQTTDIVWGVSDFNNIGFYLGISTYLIVPNPDIPISIGAQRIKYAIWSGDGSYFEIPSENSQIACNYINDLNQVTGTIISGSDTHVFSWDTTGGVVDITPGEGINYDCRDLNNDGQILLQGRIISDGTSTEAHYIWDNEDGLVSLDSLIDPTTGWQLQTVNEFNDDGWIVASAYNEKTNESGHVVLRPMATPEPGSIVAILAGLVGLVGFTSKRK